MPQLPANHVFISYSRRDTEAMLQIVSHLRGQGITAWVDNEKLVPGTPVWEREIEKAIDKASAVVVVLSPDAKESVWVLNELTLADEYKKRVFPVLVRGDFRESVHFRLVTRQFVDLRTNEERGLESLSAALGRYLDELKQLEEERLAAEREKEQQKLAELARVATQKAEEERIAKAKLEAEGLAEKKRLVEEAEKERRAIAEAERLTAQKADEERLAKTKLEAERLAEEKRLADQAEKERKDKAEAKRLVDEKAEAERLAAQKVEEERIAKAKLEAERLAEEKRLADQTEKNRQAKAEAKRLAAEKAEAERLAAQKAEDERIAKAKSTAEQPAKQKDIAQGTKKQLAVQSEPYEQNNINQVGANTDRDTRQGIARLVIPKSLQIGSTLQKRTVFLYGGVLIALITIALAALLSINTRQMANFTAIADAQRTGTAQAYTTQTFVALATNTAVANSTGTAIAQKTSTAIIKATELNSTRTAVAIATSDYVQNLDNTAKIVFGPQSGEGIFVSANAQLTNMIIEATLVNPDISEDRMTQTITFRQGTGSKWLEKFSIIIFNYKTWQLQHVSSTGKYTLIQSGQFSFDTLDKTNGGINTVRIYCQGERGALYLNGRFISGLNLSASQASGDVEISMQVLGNRQSFEYKDFAVWEIP